MKGYALGRALTDNGHLAANPRELAMVCDGSAHQLVNDHSVGPGDSHLVTYSHNDGIIITDVLRVGLGGLNFLHNDVPRSFSDAKTLYTNQTSATDTNHEFVRAQRHKPAQ